MDNNVLELYSHNIESYGKIKEAFSRGEKVVGIVHATGTGKSYNALQLAYDNKDKKIIYVTPSLGIIEHIKKIIRNNPNVDMRKDFPNLEFRTYTSFNDMSDDELSDIDVDLLILDEFHHLGAPVWGKKISKIIETHPNMDIFGMTAYTVRDRGSSYERDMANPETEELFSNKIVSRYDMCDAMIEGVLPKPIYRTAYINLIGLEHKLEEKVLSMNASAKEKAEYLRILEDAKRRIAEAPSIAEMIKKNIKKDGKYIYFCPPRSEEGTNDIETIKKEVMSWFSGYIPIEDIVFYQTTSEMGNDGSLNREAFYNDLTVDGKDAKGKLRIMFAINQYNEGVHAPGVDGVIMGRGTASDIVYFEQLGRALAVNGNMHKLYEQYEKYSIAELRIICESRGIFISDDMLKDEIIQKLIAPVIIDLTNNFDYILELENILRDRMKEIIEHGSSSSKMAMKLTDASFDIEVFNKELFDMLSTVMDKLNKTWIDYYNLAKVYYEHYGNLMLPATYRTFNGYEQEEYGIDIGRWVYLQRQNYEKLSDDKKKALEQIGFSHIGYKEAKWNKMYELAKAYYEHYGNLLIKSDFVTKDGINYDESGYKLGIWIGVQRKYYDNMSSFRRQMLSDIGFSANVHEEQWNKMYELAKIYYEHYGDLLIPTRFKTKNGYIRDDSDDAIKLGGWIAYLREHYDTISETNKKRLEEIGFVVNNVSDLQWNKMYELAKAYFEHYGNLNISKKFHTKNGYEPDDNGYKLGIWIETQRKAYNSMSIDRRQKLEKIGFYCNVYDTNWSKMYELAKEYFERYGNLIIPRDYVTENGIQLGKWYFQQRHHYERLSSDKKEKLALIGFDSGSMLEASWMKMYELAKAYYFEYGNLAITQRFRTTDGIHYNANGVYLGKWLKKQRDLQERLPIERRQLLNSIGMIWNVLDNIDEIKNLCFKYNIDYEKNKKILKHILVKEFEVKILFLLDSGKSLVDNDGKLDNIFTTSNVNMLVNYGVCLEELMTKYTNGSTLVRK